jgi:hypothetical protein
MAFQLSPGVSVSEVDNTNVVPSTLTTAGAFAGTFTWGPANRVSLVDNEITLRRLFGKPSSNTAYSSGTSFFTAANFLSYGNNLNIIRAVPAYANNAITSGAPVQVKNETQFEASYLMNDNNNAFGAWMARYPGALGNSLAVSICDDATLFNSWTYKNFFPSAPGTSTYVGQVGGSQDEMHIVVIDRQGLFTGTANTVLETYPYISKARDAQQNGDSIYYKQKIFNDSDYIYAVDPIDYANTSATWGQPASGVTFAKLVTAPTVNLTGGLGGDPTDADLVTAINLFNNKETLDISLIVTGEASTTVQQAAIDLAAARQDCIAFISPPRSAVVNATEASAMSAIQDWKTYLGRSSTYAVADSGWKYQFDPYNNIYRWIPLNADIAGLCVYTDSVRDPWFSPAGFNRGAIRNAIKLAWNPSKTYRDTLYSMGINPVVSFPGEGIILFGDKTLTVKPSAFDRINVRRLFIVLERAIARASQASLFEQNDDFTRAQFISTVSPFLREVQGRQGIVDFRVICDGTNNTQQVIDSNQFVGDIYIKPTRSINYIQLNFIAVGTGVEFTTITG